MLALLQSLTDSDLLCRVHGIVSQERKLALLLLLHLNEIERRKLHLELGYSSMFDYCVSGLGYSEPAAFRRIRTARCLARFPEVHELLKLNKVNMSTITRVSGVITESNKTALLARITRKTHREVDAIVAEYQPRSAVRDQIKAVVLRVPVTPKEIEPGLAMSFPDRPNANDGATGSEVESTATVSASGSDGFEPTLDACEKSSYFRLEGDFHPAVEPFQTEQLVQYKFAASTVFQQKVDKVKALGWHRLAGNPSLEKVFELALDCFIDKNDPRARQQRREKAKTRAAAKRRESAEPQKPR